MSSNIPLQGFMDGAAGQAIAQTLMGLAKPQQIQQPTNTMMNDLPRWMAAMQNEKVTNQQLEQNQTTFDQKQQALQLLQKLGAAQGANTPQSSVETTQSSNGYQEPGQLGQLGYAMALMGDTGNASGSFASSFKKQEDDKNQTILANLKSRILESNIDPTNPEAGMVELLRMQTPEEMKAIAAATGNDPKTLQATLDSMTNLVVSGKMNMVRPVLDNVVDQLDELYNNPGTAVLATHEKSADKTLSGIIGAASQQFVADNPNSGLTAAQVSQMVHQALPQGLASLKTMVDIHNIGVGAWATKEGVGQRDQEIGIAQQNADTSAFNADTARFGADQGLTFEQQLAKAQASSVYAGQKPQVIELGTTTIEGTGRNGIPVGEKRTVTQKAVLDPATGQYKPAYGDTAGTPVQPQGSAPKQYTPEQIKKLEAAGYKVVNGQVFK